MNNDRWSVKSIAAGVILGLLVAAAGSFTYLHPEQAEASSQPTTTSASPPASAPSPESSAGGSGQSQPSQNSSSAAGSKQLTVDNAVINQINGNTITATSDSNLYTVNTNSSTKFTSTDGTAISLSDIGVNDLIDLTGTNEGNFTVLAASVKDMSLTSATIYGTIRSVNLTDDTMIITNDQMGNLTVYTNSSSVLTDKNGKITALPNYNVGDSVTINGLWDTANNHITHVLRITDLNISL